MISIFFLTGVFLFISAPGATSLELLKDQEARAGEGEICMTPIFEVDCQAGLTCVVIEKETYVSGYCLKDNSQNNNNNNNNLEEIINLNESENN